MRVVPIAIVGRSVVFRAGLTSICNGSRFRVELERSDLKSIPRTFFGKGLHQLILLCLDEGDTDMPAQARALKERYDSLHVCVLIDQLNPHELLLAAIEADSDGLLLKDEIDAEVLLKSLDAIQSGGAVISGRLIPTIRTFLRPHEELGLKVDLDLPPMPEPVQSHAGVPLSGRERAILCQLTLGACNKRIARELGIAEATIKVHVRSLLRKLHANNRTQAAIWAVNHLRSVAGDAKTDPDAGASNLTLPAFVNGLPQKNIDN